METYSEMAKTITALSPRMACFKAAVQGHVDTARRCFTDVGTYLEPTKVLGSSVGISSAYAASLHGDPTDVGFTVAFVGKCGPNLTPVAPSATLAAGEFPSQVRKSGKCVHV